jgi:hypothetical protein
LTFNWPIYPGIKWLYELVWPPRLSILMFITVLPPVWL